MALLHLGGGVPAEVVGPEVLADGQQMHNCFLLSAVLLLHSLPPNTTRPAAAAAFSAPVLPRGKRIEFLIHRFQVLKSTGCFVAKSIQTKYWQLTLILFLKNSNQSVYCTRYTIRRKTIRNPQFFIRITCYTKMPLLYELYGESLFSLFASILP